VYVLDRTGSGRAAEHSSLLDAIPALPTSYETILERFSACAMHSKWPASGLHTQWPGDGSMKDDAVTQFAARLGPSIGSMEASHRHAARVAPALLQAIGPAVLLTHSLGGPWGWLFADAMPTHVKGIVAVEPFGPPFTAHATGRLHWGLTAAPLAYEPEVANVQSLMHEWENILNASETDPARAKRQLSHLCGIPIAVVTAEASWQAHDGHLTVEFLREAGCSVEHLRLADSAVRGNGHAPMLERNSRETAYALHRWLVRQGLARLE
jgi:pimeloyl-ACP methyl ester carboxylesterase